jgi:glycosyltransferase involved in cell wall biosynthesis
VLENGVSTDLFHPFDKRNCRLSLGLPLDAKIIGTAGAIESNRGISILFDAFLTLKEKRTDLCLAVAGPRSLAIPQGDGIIDLGVMTYQRVPQFMNALDVAVVCNADNDFGRFCFPQKAREFMACNVPLVAARVGSLKELFRVHPEWLYEPGDTMSLAKALEKRLLDRRTDYEGPPTWNDLAKQLEGIMLRICSDRLDG